MAVLHTGFTVARILKAYAWSTHLMYIYSSAKSGLLSTSQKSVTCSYEATADSLICQNVLLLACRLEENGVYGISRYLHFQTQFVC